MDMAQLMIELHSDPELMARFKTDPAGVLKAKGGQVPEGVKLKVVEDSPSVRHIVLPHLPDGLPAEASDLDNRLSKQLFHFPY